MAVRARPPLRRFVLRGAERERVWKVLARGGPMRVSEIASLSGVEIHLVRRHLTVLKREARVQSTRLAGASKHCQPRFHA